MLNSVDDWVWPDGVLETVRQRAAAGELLQLWVLASTSLALSATTDSFVFPGPDEHRLWTHESLSGPRDIRLIDKVPRVPLPGRGMDAYPGGNARLRR